MTMHLLPSFYTTTVSSRKLKNKPKTLSQLTHEKWLREKGLSLTQIKYKKIVDKNWSKEYSDTLKVEQKYQSSEMSGSKYSCSKRGIMTNLHKEPDHVRKEILRKASLCMPLYNKGGLQYATPDTDLTTVGTKSRRG